jgi:hypothetical protein
MKISPDQIVHVVVDYLSGIGRKELAKKYNVSERTIGQLIASEDLVKAKKEIAKSCTNIAAKTTSENMEKNAAEVSGRYNEAVQRNIERLSTISQVADAAVENAMYTTKGKLKKKPDVSKVLQVMELQRLVKNEYRDTIAEGNWAKVQTEFRDVLSLHGLMERLVKHGPKIFNHPDKMIGKIVEVMSKKEHVEAMKYNRVPYRVVDMLMAVQTDVVKKYVNEQEDPEKFAEAMKYVDDQNAKIQPFMDK